MSRLRKCIETLPTRLIHKALWKVVEKLPGDFEPYGLRSNDERGLDCSCGCRFFLPVDKVGADWGVCANPKSPRAGLLTWEHMGCRQAEMGRFDDE